MDGVSMVKCACGVAGRSAIEKRLASELDVLANRTFENFKLDRQLTVLPDASIGVQRTMLEGAYRKAKAFAERPEGWLYIWGLPGCGKSHLAASIANQLVKQGWTVAYRSMPAVLDMVRDSMHEGQVSETLDQLANVDLLVLDDIGADGKPTDWAEARIFIIMNSRVDKPTVFTSNADIVDLPYQARILDRLSASRRCWINASSMRAIAK